MKWWKIGVVIIIMMLMYTEPVFAQSLPPYGSEEGVMIFELNSNDIVYAQNENEKMYPASTTKLMTALVAVENCEMNELITVGDEIYDISSDSSVAGLELGESIYMSELLYALLLPSGNDAANVIAVNVGRKLTGNSTATDSECYDAFIEAMNQKAESLGMTGTHFTNPHGLHDPDHYTTVADMMILAQVAFANQTIAFVSGTTIQQVATDMNEYTWYNSNLMLYSNFDILSDYYKLIYGVSGDNAFYNEYVISGKTGSTDEAGRCIVYEAEGNGIEIIGIILNSTEDLLFSEASDTINDIIENYELVKWTQDDEVENYYLEVEVDNYHVFDDSTLKLKADTPLITLVRTEEKDSYSTIIKWDESKVVSSEDMITILDDIAEGEQVGEIEVYYGDVFVESTPLYANNAIGIRIWSDYPIIYWYVTLVLILLLLAAVGILFIRLTH
jgi:D-alanyl-D-alanine carboxypeptidase (penicillin-binding protein 5/6)